MCSRVYPLQLCFVLSITHGPGFPNAKGGRETGLRGAVVVVPIPASPSRKNGDGLKCLIGQFYRTWRNQIIKKLFGTEAQSVCI